VSGEFVKDLPNTKQTQNGGYFTNDRLDELFRLIDAPPGCLPEEVVDYYAAMRETYDILTGMRAEGSELAMCAVGFMTDLLLQIERTKT
jgi:hypothetical protein